VIVIDDMVFRVERVQILMRV